MRVAVLISVMMLCESASAQEQAILDALELEELYGYAGENGFDLRVWLSSLLGGESLPEAALSSLLEQIRGTFLSDGIGVIVKAVIAAAVLSLIRQMVQDSGSRMAVTLLCRIYMIAGLSAVFVSARSAAVRLMNAVSACSDVIIPVMITASVLSGAETESLMLGPMRGLCSGILNAVIRRYGIALVSLSACAAIAGNLSRNIRLNKMHSLIGKTVRWASGGLLAGFLAMMTLRGRIGASRDSAAVRTTRYAIENLIPVVGGNVSDSLDTLLSTARLIRNAVGTSGLVLLIHVCALPLIDIAVSSIACRIAAAVCEPIGDDTLPPLLGQFADAIELLLVLMIAAVVLCGMLVGGYMRVNSGFG